MADKTNNKPSEKPLKGQGNTEPKERRIKFDTLEGWLIILADDDIDYAERVGYVKTALAWVLGKDSKVATDIMTRPVVRKNGKQ